MSSRRLPRLSASLLLVSLAAGCASSPFEIVASRFKYRISFETGSTEFAGGNHIEVTAVWGTRSAIEVGGDYLVTGRYTLASADLGFVTLYETSEANGGDGADTDLLSQPVKRGRGDFSLVHAMAFPGFFHVSLFEADSKEPRRVANVYFGHGENLLREPPGAAAAR